MDYTPQRECVFIDNFTCGMLCYSSVIDKKPNVVQPTIEAAVIISFAFVKGKSTDVRHSTSVQEPAVVLCRQLHNVSCGSGGAFSDLKE